MLQSTEVIREPGDRPLNYTGTFLPQEAHAEAQITSDGTGQHVMNFLAETRAASSTIPLQTLFPPDAYASKRELFSVLGLQVAPCLLPRLPFRLLRERLGKGFRFHGLQPGALQHRKGCFVDPSNWSPAAERPRLHPGAAVPSPRLTALGHCVSADRYKTCPLVQSAKVCYVY